ncbi:hypothetical protein HHK36_017495 [Tetracentron sinense]|uniref:Mediator of RNA polymerase II transcription subunit 13 n=1 Tax=Tetracentron sinense TaxID=13715 RepID=A0A834Z037_TETSI|nr:hypothetical protein HHK36_017495 [Tetracentron sinense]
MGGLHHISWFQFLPSESDLNSLPDKSVKGEQKDAATLLVLSSHLQLQKEGFLSTWTSSFVGPWDPSQGMHNPDEKIKLWLFLPGRHSSLVETAQAAVSRLRVVGSGLWLAPGDSEEVAGALSQALRNCVERALKGISYVRFGDVFTRCHPFSQSEKHSSQDSEWFPDTEATAHMTSNSVIVAPHGMRGRLTGCCPNDLVKQVYFSSNKVRASSGVTVPGIPFQVAQAAGCQVRGQSCYGEVTLGCHGTGGDKELQSSSNINRNFSKHHVAESPAMALVRGVQKQGSQDHFPVLERTFIYPAEAVLVPVMRTAFARSSLKRHVFYLILAAKLGRAITVRLIFL